LQSGAEGGDGAVTVSGLQKSEAEIVLRLGVFWLLREDFAEGGDGFNRIARALQRLAEQVEDEDLVRLDFERGLEGGCGFRPAGGFLVGAAEIIQHQKISGRQLMGAAQVLLGLVELFFFELQNAQMQTRGRQIRVEAQGLFELGFAVVQLLLLHQQGAEVIPQVGAVWRKFDGAAERSGCFGGFRGGGESASQRPVGVGVVGSGLYGGAAFAGCRVEVTLPEQSVAEVHARFCERRIGAKGFSELRCRAACIVLRQQNCSQSVSGFGVVRI